MSNLRAVGLDFGTTNTVAAVANGDRRPPAMLMLDREQSSEVFRSALCFWQDDDARGGLMVEAGPAAIREYLDFPDGSRFLQSFKSVAASASFDTAPVFNKRFRFEDLGRMFLDRMVAHAGDAFAGADRLVVGRPVRYAGARPDEALARARYDAMFAGRAAEIHYVYEPLAAAYSYAARVVEPAIVLVADFGGGTSDFSVVRIGRDGDRHRSVPLGHAGLGIAGDRFDYRIVDRLVLPLLGKGGTYRSFDKVLEIPGGYFADFGDWSKLALMRNRRTLAELERLRRSAVYPDAIGRMIAIIEHELGFPLYDSVSRLKRALSDAETAEFHFQGGGLDIAASVARADFEAWVADDLARMGSAVNEALVDAGVDARSVDRVFLTGGTSLVPAVRRLFEQRFGADRIDTGDELTSIAHGLALIAQMDDLSGWAV